MKTLERSPPDDNGDPDLRAETLRKIAVFAGVVAATLAPIMYLEAPDGKEPWVAILLAALSFLVVVLVQTGRTRYTAHLLCFGGLLIATYGVYNFGSVRSASAFLFVAGVAGAGSLLGGRALLASVLFSLITLGGLTWAEVQYLLPEPAMHTGLKVWVTQSSCILVVAAMVYFSRQRSGAAWKQLNNELELRKATEIERDRSLDRFTRIFRTSPSPMIAQSARTGAILDVNPAFERCYGYSRDEMLGKQEDRLWAQPRQRGSYLKRLYAERLVTQFPTVGLRADGTTFEALISSEMGDDADDQLVITTVSDISAQSEALEKLRRSEERFSKAFHFSPMHMSITRYADGKVIDMNKVAQGVQTDGFQGEPTIAMEYWPSNERRAEFVRSLRLEGRLRGYETQLRKPDGSLVEVRVWAELIELDGDACVLACIMNVTEEKRREALLVNMARGMSPQPGESLFMALVKHMSQALSADTVFVAEIDADLHMRSLAVWRAGARAPNFTEHLDAVPQPSTLESGLAEVDTPGVPSPVDQKPASLPRQQVRSDWPLRDNQGQVIGMLSAQWKHSVPITPESKALISIFASRANAELLRHRQEREVHRLNATLEDRVRVRTEELEQVNAELNAFAYSVSHDLKSPLRAIDGFTHLLSERFSDRSTEEEREVMGRILAATHRMSNLIKDLLALARISQSTLAIREVDLTELAHSVIRQISRTLPERPRDIRISPSLMIRCDKGLARIALTNLLHNALKYTRHQPQAVIEFGQMTGPDGSSMFFVRDNGVGFDMAHADKLFKPFQRLHMPREFEGTGIGLATVRRIIERHGGSISALAQVGQGATFTFSLGTLETVKHH